MNRAVIGGIRVWYTTVSLSWFPWKAYKANKGFKNEIVLKLFQIVQVGSFWLVWRLTITVHFSYGWVSLPIDNWHLSHRTQMQCWQPQHPKRLFEVEMLYCIWKGILENDTVSGFNLKVQSSPNLSKASFTKRKVVKGKRVTLPAKSTLARVHVSFAESRANNGACYVYALIVCLWPRWPAWTRQKV